MSELEDEEYVIINLSGEFNFNSAENLKHNLKKSFKEGRDFIIRLRNVRRIDITIIKVLEDFIDKRYSGYDKEIGKKIIGNEVDLEDLEDYILNKNNVVNESGRQERLESIINQYVLEVDNL